MNIKEIVKVNVLCDSVGEFNSEHRLITLKLVYPRFIHAELLTHRMLSRNSESSRAVPTAKKLKQDMYTPEQFANKVKGMGSGKTLSPIKNLLAKTVWRMTALQCKLGSWLLSKLNVAKQWSNRPLEWFSTIEIVITGDYNSWQHFLSLRNHPDAQPEMQVLAKEIDKAIKLSIPNVLRYNEWHIPYDIQKESYAQTYNNSIVPLEDRKNISTGLCAGVSYIQHMEISKALELGKKLFKFKHLSPYEHIATCMPYELKFANFQGWKSYRYELEEKQKELKNEDQD